MCCSAASHDALDMTHKKTHDETGGMKLTSSLRTLPFKLNNSLNFSLDTPVLNCLLYLIKKKNNISVAI